MPRLLDYKGEPYYVPPSCPRTYHQFIWNVDTPAKLDNVPAMIRWADAEVEDYRRAILGNGNYYFIIVELPEMETAFRLKFG